MVLREAAPGHDLLNDKIREAISTAPREQRHTLIRLSWRTGNSGSWTTLPSNLDHVPAGSGNKINNLIEFNPQNLVTLSKK